MQNFLVYCFDKWWKPILFLVLGIGLLLVSDKINSISFQNISFCLFLLGLFGLLISFVYQLFKRQWTKSILTGLLFVATIAGLFYWSLLYLFEYHPDHYADNLKIPKDIPINIPLDYSSSYRKITSPDLQLYSSLQPGLYEYVVGIGKIEKGEIYLKAFEITHNAPLSKDELAKRSTIKVYNPTDTLREFTMERGNSAYGNPFTIYEGEWGKPYAARFEVWFKPNNGENERKLFEKNYKIEGWQR